jgi:hypothetical protein
VSIGGGRADAPRGGGALKLSQGIAVEYLPMKEFRAASHGSDMSFAILYLAPGGSRSRAPLRLPGCRVLG